MGGEQFGVQFLRTASFRRTERWSETGQPATARTFAPRAGCSGSGPGTLLGQFARHVPEVAAGRFPRAERAEVLRAAVAEQLVRRTGQRSAVHLIVAVAAVQDVRAGTAFDQVRIGVAELDVAVRAAAERVVAALP